LGIADVEVALYRDGCRGLQRQRLDVSVLKAASCFATDWGAAGLAGWARAGPQAAGQGSGARCPKKKTSI